MFIYAAHDRGIASFTCMYLTLSPSLGLCAAHFPAQIVVDNRRLLYMVLLLRSALDNANLHTTDQPASQPNLYNISCVCTERNKTFKEWTLCGLFSEFIHHQTRQTYSNDSTTATLSGLVKLLYSNIFIQHVAVRMLYLL